MDVNKKWELAIAEAKRVVNQIEGYQMRIANLAIKVCEITWGGAVKLAEQRDKYTLSRFASETGVNVRTLSNWIGMRKLVFDKLSKAQQNKAVYADLLAVARKVNRQTPVSKVREAFEDHMSCDTFERKCRRYLYELRSLEWNFRCQAAAFKLSDETLKETLFFCGKIIEEIKKDRPGIVPEFCGISTRFKASAAAATLDREQAR